MWCGEAGNHRPWPTGVPYEEDTVVGGDGTRINVCTVRRESGQFDVSLIIRWDSHRRDVPLSPKAAERLWSTASTACDWAYYGGWS